MKRPNQDQEPRDNVTAKRPSKGELDALNRMLADVRREFAILVGAMSESNDQKELDHRAA